MAHTLNKQFTSALAALSTTVPAACAFFADDAEHGDALAALTVEVERLRLNYSLLYQQVAKDKLTEGQAKLSNTIVRLSETAVVVHAMEAGGSRVTISDAGVKELTEACAQLNKSVSRKGAHIACIKAVAVVTVIAAASTGAAYYFHKKAEETSDTTSA